MISWLPPPVISVILVTAPIIYHFCSHYAYSIIIIYTHAFILSIWLCSIAEFRLLCQELLGLGPGKSTTGSENDMYGLQHTLYNVQVVPETFWFNMGYWNSDTQSFAQACQLLVRKVMTQMGKHQQKGRILDVGFGCGDSCFMMAEEYDYQVTGITIESSQFEIAQRRLQDQYSHLNKSVQLIKGSATDLTTIFKNTPPFDNIIAIDCAYHFDTRWTFLNQCVRLLAPNGRIGLFDVAIQPNAFSHPYKRRIFDKICSMGNLPVANLVDHEEYEARLRHIGYTDIQIVRIDVNTVYGGLSRFLKRQGTAYLDAGLDLSLGNHVRFFIVAYIMDFLCWCKWIEPIIVTAKAFV